MSSRPRALDAMVSREALMAAVGGIAGISGHDLRKEILPSEGRSGSQFGKSYILLDSFSGERLPGYGLFFFRCYKCGQSTYSDQGDPSSCASYLPSCGSETVRGVMES